MEGQLLLYVPHSMSPGSPRIDDTQVGEVLGSAFRTDMSRLYNLLAGHHVLRKTAKEPGGVYFTHGNEIPGGLSQNRAASQVYLCPL